MIVFLGVLLVYTGILCLYKPLPLSLRLLPISYTENFNQVKATFVTGLLIIVVFLVSTNLSFSRIDIGIHKMLAVNNVGNNGLLWPLQIVSHSFLHFNLLHLLSNLVLLMFLSPYNRRVGNSRYIKVLIVGCIASMLSIFFYSTPIYIVGISGGLFALAAAYITDHKNLDVKEWVAAVVTFVVLAGLLEVKRAVDNKGLGAQSMEVDHLGHFLGALGAIIYCRIWPRETSMPKSAESPSISKQAATSSKSSLGNALVIDEAYSNEITSTNLTRMKESLDRKGQPEAYLNIESTLLTPFFQALKSGDEGALKEQVFNLFFRIEDRLNRKSNKQMGYEEVIQFIEQSELEAHVGLFRRYLLGCSETSK